MMPMQCPKCSYDIHRIRQVNSLDPERIVRQRECTECGHRWFTVELQVTPYALYWQRVGHGTSGKPQVREDAVVKLAVDLGVEKS
jgi:hypothetical protein